MLDEQTGTVDGGYRGFKTWSHAVVESYLSSCASSERAMVPCHEQSESETPDVRETSDVRQAARNPSSAFWMSPEVPQLPVLCLSLPSPAS